MEGERVMTVLKSSDTKKPIGDDRGPSSLELANYSHACHFNAVTSGTVFTARLSYAGVPPKPPVSVLNCAGFWRLQPTLLCELFAGLGKISEEHAFAQTFFIHGNVCSVLSVAGWTCVMRVAGRRDGWKE